ncbi:carbohydrate esterase family 16 protein [Mycena rebaudengoi]|nr:carbohydrate esterase family 16 protein [Mycena rebaudengoi]
MIPCSKTLLCAVALAVSCVRAVGVRPNQIKHLVTFGDSYTDIVATGDRGVAWPVYAAGYSKTTLHPFARSGGTCSNDITPRPFPPVFGSQLPLYFAETANGSLVVPSRETIYTLWIGTNDLGIHSLITGSNGASIVDVTECMIDWVKVLYKSGARNFIFQNMIPLELTILYAPDSYPNRFWANPRNTTAWSVLMKELILSGNKLAELMLKDLAPSLPGSHIALFDSHSLFQDMFDHPAKYLNGTAPFNVTSAVNACVAPLGGGPLDCTVATGTDVDSFLWADELHPSEQADRIVAREIALTMEGKRSQWTTWLN